MEKAIKNLEFLVVQDIFMTETSELADVVLPAACYAEKDGTQTSTERRVQMWRKAQDAPGQTKLDWEIMAMIAAKMGYEKQFAWKSAKEIFEEIAKVTPSYAGMTYERLNRPEALHWPCPSADHPGTPILHKEKFAHPDGLGQFFACAWKPPAEVPDAEYPFILTTGRCLWHWHTGTMTRRSVDLEAEEPTGGSDEPRGCKGARSCEQGDGTSNHPTRRGQGTRPGNEGHHERCDVHAVPLQGVCGKLYSPTTHSTPSPRFRSSRRVR